MVLRAQILVLVDSLEILLTLFVVIVIQAVLLASIQQLLAQVVILLLYFTINNAFQYVQQDFLIKVILALFVSLLAILVPQRFYAYLALITICLILLVFLNVLWDSIKTKPI